MKPEPMRVTSTERLREVRVELRLQVKLWGLDSSGKPFTVLAETIEISAYGARLICPIALTQGEIIGILYMGEKARFRVAWVGQAGTEKAGQIGIQALEESKCIWADALRTQALDEWGAASEAEAPASAAVPATPQGAERRRSPRYVCSGTVQVSLPPSKAKTTLRLIDVGFGGCYAETMSPAPIGTALNLVLHVGEVEFSVRAVVRTAHAAVGMGMVFTHLDPDQWKLLARLIAGLSGPTTHELKAATPAPPPKRETVEEALASVLRLLERKGLISISDFLQELKKSDV